MNPLARVPTKSGNSCPGTESNRPHEDFQSHGVGADPASNKAFPSRGQPVCETVVKRQLWAGLDDRPPLLPVPKVRCSWCERVAAKWFQRGDDALDVI